MTEFKIKILCTSFEQLSFNNKKISKNNKICFFDPNIEKIIILHKTLNMQKFTTKTLEFIYNKQLNEEEFIKFIHTLKEHGFKTTTPKNKIQFIQNNTNPFTTLFNYTFIDVKKIGLDTSSKKKNRSSYKTETVYSKL
jgi:hypothetical protein